MHGHSERGSELELIIAVETRGCHGFGVFDKAVSSWFENVSEEHGLTEVGKTVPPFSKISVPKSLRLQQRKHPLFRSFLPSSFGLPMQNLRGMRRNKTFE